MHTYRLGFIGFGNVGKTLLALLESRGTELEQRYGITFLYTGISTLRHGSAVDPAGIDPAKALAAGNLGQLSPFSIPRMASILSALPGGCFIQIHPSIMTPGSPQSTTSAPH